MSADPEDILAAIRSDIDPKTLGLFPKFDIIHRERGELVTDPCFVLNVKTDPIARVAVRAYARAAHDAGYEQLAQDLTAMVYRVEAELGIAQRASDAPAAPGTFNEARFDVRRGLKDERELDTLLRNELYKMRDEMRQKKDLDD